MSFDQPRHLTGTIREIDGLPCSHPASVNVDVANFFYAFTKMVRPLLVVEIGCFIGFSTQHFAQALRELGFGKVISIDAFDWQVDAGRGPQDRREIAEFYRRKAGLKDVVTFVKGYAAEAHGRLSAELRGGIDLLFIDGDHGVRGVFEDFNTYFGDVRTGGYLILHDIYPSMCGCDGPRTLIDTLKARGHVPRRLELTEMPTKDGFGIAVLRKVGRDPLRLTPLVSSLARRAVGRLLRRPATPIGKDRVAAVITVIDGRSGERIRGARFLCPQRWDEERFTADDGTIVLEHYLPNRYLADFSAPGYVTKSGVLLDISCGAPRQEFTVALEPAGPAGGSGSSPG